MSQAAARPASHAPEIASLREASARYTERVPLGPTPRPQRTSRALLIIGLYAGLGAIAIVWGALRGHADIYRIPAALGTSTPAKLAASPVIGLLFGLAVVFLTRLLTHRFEWARVLHREFHAVVGELSSREMFILAIASAVGEELFFRGALVPQIGVVLGAAVFALLHVRPAARFLPWTVMSFIVGLVMGQMYVSLGDLGGPMVAHFTINLINLNYIARTELRA